MSDSKTVCDGNSGAVLAGEDKAIPENSDKKKRQRTDASDKKASSSNI